MAERLDDRPRVLVERTPAAGERVVLGGAEAHHLRHVLRLGRGQPIWLLDGKGMLFSGVIAGQAAGGVVIEVGEGRPAPGEPPLRITLVQGLAKGEKLDWVVQKATELGVGRILPVQTERSVVDLGPERATRRVERWRRIAREATRQCRRGRVPEISTPETWEGCLERFGREGPAASRVGFLPWEECSGPGLLAAVRAAFPDGRVPPGVRELFLFVGPEGGFTEEEVRAARQVGVTPVSLGPRILRTETAAVAGLAVVVSWLESGAPAQG